jgi:cysteine-rich repeat protein
MELQTLHTALWHGSEYILNGTCVPKACPLCEAGKVAATNNRTSCDLCPLHSYAGAGMQYCSPCSFGTVTLEQGAKSKSMCVAFCQKGTSSSNVSGLSPCFGCQPGKYQDNLAQSTCKDCPFGSYMPRFFAISCEICPEGKSTASTGAMDLGQCMGWPAKFLNPSFCETSSSSSSSSGLNYSSVYLADEGAISAEDLEIVEGGSKYIAGVLVFDTATAPGAGVVATFQPSPPSLGAAASISISNPGHSYSSTGSTLPYYASLEDALQPVKLQTGSMTQLLRRPFVSLLETPQTFMTGCSSGAITAESKATAPQASEQAQANGLLVHYTADAAGSINSLCFGKHSGETTDAQCHEARENRGENLAENPALLVQEGSIQAVRVRAASQSRGCRSIGQQRLLVAQDGQVARFFRGTYSVNKFWRCSPGFTGPDNSFQCKRCEQGKYKDTAGELECVSCPAGASSLSGSNKLDCCICTAGYTGQNGGNCSLCAAGKYKNLTGDEICSDCAPGTYSAEAGATTKGVCKSCPHGSHSASGSTSFADCTCNAGYADTKLVSNELSPSCLWHVECGDGCPYGGAATGAHTCNPTACGDAVKSSNEECDDGNTLSGDGCSAECLAVEPGWNCTRGNCSVSVCKGVCGNGIITMGEECDDANTVSADGCSASCAIECGYYCKNSADGVIDADASADAARDVCSPRCGDSKRAGNETCDDGNTVSGDGCSSNCSVVERGWNCSSLLCHETVCREVCGDGIATMGEGCDDGNSASGDGCSSSCGIECGYDPIICGDGMLASTRESCDDGNIESDDGCSSACTVEVGFECMSYPAQLQDASCEGSKCFWQTGTEVCGDAQTLGAEKEIPNFCDDGNNVDGDGCSARCRVECGYKCSGPAASNTTTADICYTVCGDALLAGNETCDDGNTVSGDGCSAECLAVEPGWNCSGSRLLCAQSVCKPICGDGKVRAEEECDDANTLSADGCSASCAIECGYYCATASDTATPSVCSPRCGDSKRSGNETCDDGNTVSGDGCTNCSVVERGWNCSSLLCRETVCREVCGDGIATMGEECDDGNSASGDGCSSSCGIECGYYCAKSEPNVCYTRCGDSTIAGNETCDDGNTLSGDGCRADCEHVEHGWTCNSTSPICGQSYCKGACRSGVANVTCSGSGGCSCSPAFGATSGTFSDGPSNYVNNANCKWLISSTAVITLSVLSFDTEVNFDYLTINYCTSSSCDGATQIARLTGRSLSAHNFTSTGYLQVSFISDSRENRYSVCLLY